MGYNTFHTGVDLALRPCLVASFLLRQSGHCADNPDPYLVDLQCCLCVKVVGQAAWWDPFL